MAVGVIEGLDRHPGVGCGVLYDTVTDWAFGPVFKDADEANAFLDYLLEKNLGDPRSMEDNVLREHYHEFLKVKDVREVHED